MARFVSEVTSVFWPLSIRMETLAASLPQHSLGIIGQPSSLHVVPLPPRVDQIGNLCNNYTNLRINENKEPDQVSLFLRLSCLPDYVNGAFLTCMNNAVVVSE